MRKGETILIQIASTGVQRDQYGVGYECPDFYLPVSLKESLDQVIVKEFFDAAIL
jgi:hypothetical protein